MTEGRKEGGKRRKEKEERGREEGGKGREERGERREEKKEKRKETGRREKERMVDPSAKVHCSDWRRFTTRCYCPQPRARVALVTTEQPI